MEGRRRAGERMGGAGGSAQAHCRLSPSPQGLGASLGNAAKPLLPTRPVSSLSPRAPRRGQAVVGVEA